MRLAGQSRRDWALAIGGGLVLAGVLVAALRPDSFGLGRPVPVATAPPAPALPPAPPVMAPPPSGPPPAVAIADLALHGLIQRPGGAAAIIARSGQQRLVRIGGSVAPGLRLVRITPRGAILSGPQGDIMLAFPGEQAAAAGPPAAPPAAGATAWRLALRPVRGATGISGWQLVDPTPLPLLVAAGLRTGDIITDVDGEALFSEEKLLELPQRLAGNPRASIGYRRGGQKSTALLGSVPGG